MIDKTIEAIKTIRPITSVAEGYVKIFVEMMNGAFAGTSVADLCKQAASQIENFGNLDDIIKEAIPVKPCGIVEGWLVSLQVMYRNPTNVYDALLCNANAGGDNTSRGFVIGAIMGAALGGDKGLDGMHDKEA